MAAAENTRTPTSKAPTRSRTSGWVSILWYNQVNLPIFYFFPVTDWKQGRLALSNLHYSSSSAKYCSWFTFKTICLNVLYSIPALVYTGMPQKMFKTFKSWLHTNNRDLHVIVIYLWFLVDFFSLLFEPPNNPGPYPIAQPLSPAPLIIIQLSDFTALNWQLFDNTNSIFLTE